MSTQTLPFLVMTGSSEGSEPEVMVSRARQAITLDMVDRALEVPALGPMIVATNSADLACLDRAGPAGRGIPVRRQAVALDPDQPLGPGMPQWQASMRQIHYLVDLLRHTEYNRAAAGVSERRRPC
ncbi:hypothetical protein ACFLUM_03755 [Chloroflexota bacterium]